MRKRGVFVFWGFFCAISLGVLLYEYSNSSCGIHQAEAGVTPLPYGSAMLGLIEDKEEFNEYKKKTLNRRLKIIKKEILTKIAVCIISLMFIVDRIRRWVVGKMDYDINLITTFMPRSYTVDVNTVTLYLLPLFGTLYRDVLYNIGMTGLEKRLFVFTGVVIFFILFIPAIISFCIFLISKFGSTILYLVYLSYLMRMIVDFFDQSEVDTNKMDKVDISRFSGTVQSELRRLGLENDVYEEKKKSKSMNAALVSWGTKRRIEIYGDVSEFSQEEFEAVLLHEMGHYTDGSLVKKFTTRLFIYVLEMLAILYIYHHISPLFAFPEESFTREGAFIVLGSLYIALTRQWAYSLYYFVSQSAEQASDIAAFKQNRGHDLAFVLYKIGINSREFISASYFYNLLHSYHPTIYSRIERLLQYA